jgi:predicted metal-dependent enzyme (double-stranded beta helix superfamily)
MPSKNRAPETPYGAQPGVKRPVLDFARRVTEILDREAEEDWPRLVRDAMDPLLEQSDLLAPEHREPGEKSYRRHVLYADARGRFTILALVWRPGQTTPIHGHSAWGAVGVYEGRPNVACYACPDGAEPRLLKEIHCKPGDTTCVRPGFEDAHRIYNATDETIITLHAYGRDLVAAPESINLVVAAG